MPWTAFGTFVLYMLAAVIIAAALTPAIEKLADMIVVTVRKVIKDKV